MFFLNRAEKKIINDRKKILENDFDVAKTFRSIEESCIPSYCHRNTIASYISWLRLAYVSRCVEKYQCGGSILDFGAASGEIFHFIEPKDYHFIENNPALVQYVRESIPKARRVSLDKLNDGRYDCILAVDSLEHNSNISEIIDDLVKALKEDGKMILSGPTENIFYRLGRRTAGFQGGYHTNTVRFIEKIVSRQLKLLRLKRIGFPFTLFRISVWTKS